MPPLLEIQDLTVIFRGEHRAQQVLNNVSLTLSRGEALGVVGESGSGKTTLVRAILGLLQTPWEVTQGRVFYASDNLLDKDEASLRRIRGKEIALTTPEPRKHLNPLLTIGVQLGNVIRAHADVTRAAAQERALGLLQAVGIPDPQARLHAYPHELSGGMCQRVIIAMALIHSAKLLLADEPTAGLDVTISRQILDLMQDLVRDFDSSLILVSRDLGVIAHYCQRVAVMYAGQIVELAEVPTFFANPAHPYSRHLVRAAAAARNASERRTKLGTRDRPSVGPCCQFAPRCPVAVARCDAERPAIEAVAVQHWARCFRKQEVLSGALSA